MRQIHLIMSLPPCSFSMSSSALPQGLCTHYLPCPACGTDCSTGSFHHLPLLQCHLFTADVPNYLSKQPNQIRQLPSLHLLLCGKLQAIFSLSNDVSRLEALRTETTSNLFFIHSGMEQALSESSINKVKGV